MRAAIYDQSVSCQECLDMGSIPYDHIDWRGEAVADEYPCHCIVEEMSKK